MLPQECTDYLQSDEMVTTAPPNTVIYVTSRQKRMISCMAPSLIGLRQLLCTHNIALAPLVCG